LKGIRKRQPGRVIQFHQPILAQRLGVGHIQVEPVLRISPIGKTVNHRIRQSIGQPYPIIAPVAAGSVLLRSIAIEGNRNRPSPNGKLIPPDEFATQSDIIAGIELIHLGLTHRIAARTDGRGRQIGPDKCLLIATAARIEAGTNHNGMGGIRIVFEAHRQAVAHG